MPRQYVPAAGRLLPGRWHVLRRLLDGPSCSDTGGVYFVHLRHGREQQIRKFVLTP